MKKKKLKEIATPKQARAIELIERFCEVKFKGKTKEDVSTFIGKYLHDAVVLSELDSFTLKAAKAPCVPVYHASFQTRERQGEEFLDRRTPIAREKLKGAILRGESAEEALARFAVDSCLEQATMEYDDF
jgi:hypothetical protein